MSEPVIGKDGVVIIDGRKIGRVWKGMRNTRLPSYRSNTVVRTPRQVSCWWGASIHPNYMKFDRKTRKAVIERLMEMDKDA